MNNTKPIWRKNFDIFRVDYNLPIETAPGFGGSSYFTVGKNIISKMIWVEENLNNTATYFLKHELRELIRLTMDTIFKNPKKVRQVHKKTIALNWEYLRLAQKIRKFNLQRLSNKQLLYWHGRLFDLQYRSHVRSLPTTWYLDSDGEDFSKYMVAWLETRLKELCLNLDSAEIFSILSTPNGQSFTMQEEMESLLLLQKIQADKKIKHWFMSHSTEELCKDFYSLPMVWQKKINSHYEKWRWTPYTYIGPAYNLDYYLEVWRGLLHEDVDPNEKIKNLKSKFQNIQKQKNKFIKLLKLTPLERQWFEVAAEIVCVKGFRKEITFHGFFVLDLLLKEIGKRAGLSLIQTKFLLPRELGPAMTGKNFANIANERMKFSVIYCQTAKKKSEKWNDKGIKIYTGQTARAFLKKQKFEKIKIQKTDMVSGSCACTGTARGTVRIINVPEEMNKMNQGDIMLSHTTFPSLVPAMKKAAAIITEDGGITCHAAIVARELQTPCIVGCKNITKIFKDGDLVEVNANKGTVKKL